jgi:hypothetical protein
MDFASSEPTTPRRKWIAIGAATVVQLVSYWSIILAFVLATEDAAESPEVGAAAPFALGLLLIPFVFLVLAFASRHRRAPIAALKAVGLMVLLTLPTAVFLPAGGLLLGFAAGGILALRAEQWQRYSTRWIAVAVAVVYTLGVSVIAPPLGVFAGSVIPFVTLGVADHISDQRHRFAAGQGTATD